MANKKAVSKLMTFSELSEIYPLTHFVDFSSATSTKQHHKILLCASMK